MAEFSNMPMPNVEDYDRFYDLIPGKMVTNYLEEYVDSHTYNSQTLRSRILTNTRVSSVSKVARKWSIITAEKKTYTARNLVHATGLTSIPNIPTIPGISEFRGLKLCHMDFGQLDILIDNSIHHIAVIEGAKSAADIAYSATKGDKTVS
jgi:cation diffusion facilitator CzcD-associated flavoprotein CzcO